MHYGEFRMGYFLSIVEKETLCQASDTGGAVPLKPRPVDSAFPLPFALALAVIAITTIALGLWHL
jgi:hypothetical protein